MLVEDVLVRPISGRQVSLSWTSQTDNARSWIFVNGRFSLGPFMGDAKERSIVLEIPDYSTFVVEVHDFDDDTVPSPIEEPPQIRPTIAWNGVSDSQCYRVYHTIFDSGEIETLLCEVPPYSQRMEIDCPIKLEGRGGRWHSFRIETVDQFGAESESEIIPHYATDLPAPSQLTITRDTDSSLLSFTLL